MKDGIDYLSGVLYDLAPGSAVATKVAWDQTNLRFVIEPLGATISYQEMHEPYVVLQEILRDRLREAKVAE